MKIACCVNWKNVRCATLALTALLAFEARAGVAQTQEPQAVTPEVQQLKDRLQQLANLLYYPYENMMVGGEFQWGRRENFLDGFKSDDSASSFPLDTTFPRRSVTDVAVLRRTVWSNQEEKRRSC